MSEIDQRVSEMSGILKGIVKQMYGNGQEGFVKTIPRLEDKISTLVDTVSAQTVVISDLVKFQSSIQGVETYKEKKGFSNRQRAGLCISTVIGVGAIIVSLIIKFA